MNGCFGIFQCRCPPDACDRAAADDDVARALASFIIQGELQRLLRLDRWIQVSAQQVVRNHIHKDPLDPFQFTGGFARGFGGCFGAVGM